MLTRPTAGNPKPESGIYLRRSIIIGTYLTTSAFHTADTFPGSSTICTAGTFRTTDPFIAAPILLPVLFILGIIVKLLRHHPEKAGVILDEHGWTDVQALIEKVGPRYPLTEELLHKMAYGPDKQRYEFSEDGKKVRACHGHSVRIKMDYEETVPPDILYHGTSEKYKESIEREGLVKKNRLFVHLSRSSTSAICSR